MGGIEVADRRRKLVQGALPRGGGPGGADQPAPRGVRSDAHRVAGGERSRQIEGNGRSGSTRSPCRGGTGKNHRSRAQVVAHHLEPAAMRKVGLRLDGISVAEPRHRENHGKQPIPWVEEVQYHRLRGRGLPDRRSGGYGILEYPHRVVSGEEGVESYGCRPRPGNEAWSAQRLAPRRRLERQVQVRVPDGRTRIPPGLSRHRRHRRPGQGVHLDRGCLSWLRTFPWTPEHHRGLLGLAVEHQRGSAFERIGDQPDRVVGGEQVGGEGNAHALTLSVRSLGHVVVPSASRGIPRRVVDRELDGQVRGRPEVVAPPTRAGGDERWLAHGVFVHEDLRCHGCEQGNVRPGIE